MKQRDIPRELPRQAEQAPLPMPAVEASDLVEINSVQFDGDLTLLPENERRTLTADVIGQKLDFAGLTALTSRITAALKKRGWMLARAYIPPQDLISGELMISIVSGRLDSSDQSYRVEAEGKVPLRISKKRLQRMARAKVKQGDAISEVELTQALLLMNDLPGVSVRAALEPGAEPGSTRIALRTKQKMLLRPSLAINNFGGETTGVRQISGSLGIEDPFGWGDRMTVGLVKTKGMTLNSVGYQIPIGYSGLTFQGSLSRLRYTSLNGAALKAGLRGRARTMRAGLSYPLVRTVRDRMDLDVSFSRERMRDDSTYAVFNDKALNTVTVDFSGDVLDDLGGGGRTLWSIRPAFGKLTASALASRVKKDSDFDAYRSVGSFGKLSFQFSRLQSVVPRVTVYANVQGQIAQRNLDSSQKFYPAGPSALRAYDSSEASADKGALVQAEVRYSMPLPFRAGTVQFAAFYDRARVWLHHKNYNVPIDTVSGRNNYSLHGAGVGATVNFPMGGYVRASWAKPIGDNPGQSSRTTTPQDTTPQGRGRFWLQAGFQF